MENETMYQYRSIDVFQKIIESKKLRLTSAYHQNDKKELKLLLDYFDGKEPESKLAKKIDQKVFEAKRNDQWRREYMSYQMELNQQYRNGKEEGRKEGIDDMSKLIKMLISENKYEEIEKAVNDEEYQKALMRKYRITK